MKARVKGTERARNNQNVSVPVNHEPNTQTIPWDRCLADNMLSIRYDGRFRTIHWLTNHVSDIIFELKEENPLQQY